MNWRHCVRVPQISNLIRKRIREKNHFVFLPHFSLPFGWREIVASFINELKTQLEERSQFTWLGVLCFHPIQSNKTMLSRSEIKLNFFARCARSLSLLFDGFLWSPISFFVSEFENCADDDGRSYAVHKLRINAKIEIFPRHGKIGRCDFVFPSCQMEPNQTVAWWLRRLTDVKQTLVISHTGSVANGEN